MHGWVDGRKRLQHAAVDGAVDFKTAGIEPLQERGAYFATALICAVFGDPRPAGYFGCIRRWHSSACSRRRP